MADIHNELAKYAKSLMFKEPFYGLMLISLNKVIDESIPTLCVSKSGINFNLHVNPTFWKSLDDVTKLGVFKHEMLHIAFFHLLQMDRYHDKELFNIAADLEINQYIEPSLKGPSWSGLDINLHPFQPLNLPTFAGTKVYYDLLIAEKKKNPGFLGELDPHHMLWGEVSEAGEAEQKMIRKQIEHQLKDIADHVNKSYGKLPKEIEEMIGNIEVDEEPTINWKEYLRRFNGFSQKVYTKKSRRKLNKRFSDNPALKIKQRKNTLVGIDTSGSVSNKELLEFFNEIHHIFKTGTNIDIIECDAQIQRVYKYDGKNKDIKVMGRGGTSFDPVIDYLNEHKSKYQNLIYLTDGCCSPPKHNPVHPVLWVHSSTSAINENLPGTKIKITHDDAR